MFMIILDQFIRLTEKKNLNKLILKQKIIDIKERPFLVTIELGFSEHLIEI